MVPAIQATDPTMRTTPARMEGEHVGQNSMPHKYPIPYGNCPEMDPHAIAVLSEIRRKATDDQGNFLGGTLENDLYGHPAFEQETITVWEKYGSGRMEIHFRHLADSSEFSLLLIDRQPILIMSDHIPEGDVEGDSIFIHEQRILLWKNRAGRCVTDTATLSAQYGHLLGMMAALLRWYDGYSADPDSTSAIGRMDRSVRAGAE